jgi:hypothetical protein
MSDQMLKYLETFLPFLNGIHESLMKFVEDVFNEGEIEDSEEVFLVYIKKDEIKLSSSLKKNKIKFSKYVQTHVLPLPFEKDLKKELKSIQSLKNSSKKDPKVLNDASLENKMRDAFIDVFVKMFYDYEKYIGILDDDVVFNKVLFMNTITKDEQFYEEFIDCQLFQQFTQNLLKEGCSYFNKKIKEAKEKEKKSNKRAGGGSLRSSATKQETIYLIRPDYLGIKENDKIVIENAIKENYQETEDNEEANKIKNRILDTINPIDPEKYINSNCIIYLIQEKKDQGKEDENKNKLQALQGKGNDFLKKNSTIIIGGDLTEKQIDKIKEDIKEMVIKIYKSEIGSDTKSLKTEAFRNFETSFGRSFFVALISNNNNNIISLQEDSFVFLENLIYGLLNSILKLEETDQIIKEVVILIKSTKFFQKAVTKEKGYKNTEGITLFDSLKKKLLRYNKINQKNFWLKWFKLELKKKDPDEQQSDDVKIDLIIEICKEMILFEIPKGIMKNICDTINKTIFEGGSENYIKTEKEYKELITNANYISKAL